jgi:sec-independent protein translocase protein TatB
VRRNLALRERPYRSEDQFSLMFDFAWSEIALIAGVALVVIGPKDLPVALRAVSGFVKKARRMAGEFQTHVDEMMRDADLKEVKDSINQIRNFDFRSTVEQAVDPDHTLRDTFNNNPLDPAAASSGTDGSVGSTAGEPMPDDEEKTLPAPPVRVAAPPFIPPALVPFVCGPKPPEPPPPFIPPAAMLQPPSA